MIELDLRNLTEELITEAALFTGECSYQAPCIIGTLMTTAERFNTAGSISSLVWDKKVKFPNQDQAELAGRLQRAFDNGDPAPYEAALNEVRALRDSVSAKEEVTA